MKIFLSYAREDEAQVISLYDALKGAGYEPWMDIRDLTPGDDWKESIERAIKHCDMFLIFMSRHSVNKRGIIQIEIRSALRKAEEYLPGDIFVVPVRLDQCEVPERLAQKQWVSVRDPNWWLQLNQAIAKAQQRKSNITAYGGEQIGSISFPKVSQLLRSKWFLRSRRLLATAAAGVLVVMTIGFGGLLWMEKRAVGPLRGDNSCSSNISFACIQRGEVKGRTFTDISTLACRKELVYQSNDTTLNWKNVWTTSVYSYAPGGGGPGGGLEDDVLKVGGWGDWYFSLIQFDVQAGPFAFGVPRFAALLLYTKADKLGPVAMLLERVGKPWGAHDSDRLWWKDQPTAEDPSGQLPPPQQASWYFVEITTLYQDWLSKKFPNYGLRLRPISNQGTINLFVSSLAQDATTIPRLLVCW